VFQGAQISGRMGRGIVEEPAVIAEEDTRRIVHRHRPEQEMQNEEQQQVERGTVDQRDQQVLPLRRKAQQQIAENNDP
jgi:hypothetical protein